MATTMAIWPISSFVGVIFYLPPGAKTHARPWETGIRQNVGKGNRLYLRLFTLSSEEMKEVVEERMSNDDQSQLSIANRVRSVRGETHFQ